MKQAKKKSGKKEKKGPELHTNLRLFGLRSGNDLHYTTQKTRKLLQIIVYQI